MKTKDYKQAGKSSGYPSGVKSNSFHSTSTTQPNSGLSTTAKGRHNDCKVKNLDINATGMGGIGGGKKASSY